MFSFASRIAPFDDGTPSSLQLALQTCAAIRAAHKASAPSAPLQPVAVPNPRGATTTSLTAEQKMTAADGELVLNPRSRTGPESVSLRGGPGSIQDEVPQRSNPVSQVGLAAYEWERADTFQMLSPFSPEVAVHLQQQAQHVPLSSSSETALPGAQQSRAVVHPSAMRSARDALAVEGEKCNDSSTNNCNDDGGGGGGTSMSFKTQLLPSMLIADSASRYAIDDDDASLADDDWLVGGDHPCHARPQQRQQGMQTNAVSYRQTRTAQGVELQHARPGAGDRSGGVAAETDTTGASSSNLLLPAGTTTILRTDAGRSHVATTLLGVSTVVSDLDDSTEPVTFGGTSDKFSGAALSHHNGHCDDLSVSREDTAHAATLRPAAAVRGAVRMPTITAMARDALPLGTASEMSLSPAVVPPTPASGAVRSTSPQYPPAQDGGNDENDVKVARRTHRSVATETGTAVLWPLPNQAIAESAERGGESLAPVVDRIRGRIDEQLAKVTVRDAALHLATNAQRDGAQPSQGCSSEELALHLYSLKQQVVLLSQLVLQSCAAAAGPPPLGASSPGSGGAVAAAVFQSHSSYDFSTTSAPRPRRSGGGGGGAGRAAAGSSGAPIHVRVVRDYDPPVVPYHRNPIAGMQRSGGTASAVGPSQASGKSGAAGGRSSSPLPLAASTQYSSDWTGASKSRVHSIMTEDSVAVMSSLSSFADSR